MTSSVSKKSNFRNLLSEDSKITKQIKALEEKKAKTLAKLNDAATKRFLENFLGKWYFDTRCGTYPELVTRFCKLCHDEESDTYVKTVVSINNDSNICVRRDIWYDVKVTWLDFKAYEIVPESYIKQLVDDYKDDLDEMFKKQ